MIVLFNCSKMHGKRSNLILENLVLVRYSRMRWHYHSRLLRDIILGGTVMAPHITYSESSDNFAL
jgi:hypothetical protein